MSGVRNVVFDLGGVLIDWNPRYLFRSLFAGDDGAMEAFLRDVCNHEWNERQDAGREWSEAVALLSAARPEFARFIEAYRDRWSEMLKGEITGTVAILAELKRAGIPLYSITNWSHETFAVARARFEFLGWFRDIVVSGEEKRIKPDPRIYEILIERNGLNAPECLFIDDVERNVQGAEAVGMRALRFQSPAQLRSALVEARVLQ